MYTQRNRLQQLSDLEDESRSYTCPARAVGTAKSLLYAVISEPRWPKPTGRIGRSYDLLMHRDLPYVIHFTDIPGTQILVNRQYKPVGSNLVYPWVRYEDYANLHTQLTPAQIAAICSPLPTALFDDGNPPWKGRREAREYMKKLELLSSFLQNTPSMGTASARSS
jgi:hypothetical protein